VILAATAFDLQRPPAEQRTTRLALGAIELYQHALSPLLARAGVHCRFRPTCSVYGAEVIRHDGVLVGGGRALWRILRCGPWTPAGTYDPPWWEAAYGEDAEGGEDDERSREATR
jgi:putative membrane protein insertion efficiency factor